MLVVEMSELKSPQEPQTQHIQNGTSHCLLQTLSPLTVTPVQEPEQPPFNYSQCLLALTPEELPSLGRSLS